jgi:hypothetical protein
VVVIIHIDEVFDDLKPIRNHHNVDEVLVPVLRRCDELSRCQLTEEVLLALLIMIYVSGYSIKFKMAGNDY